MLAHHDGRLSAQSAALPRNDDQRVHIVTFQQHQTDAVQDQNAQANLEWYSDE